jgi:hypothetical protein
MHLRFKPRSSLALMMVLWAAADVRAQPAPEQPVENRPEVDTVPPPAQHEDVVPQVAPPTTQAAPAEGAPAAKQLDPPTEEPATKPTPEPASQEPVALPGGKIAEPLPDWSPLSPGAGFRIVKTPYADMSIGAYILLRYLNQLPAPQNFTDHLGNTLEVDARQDIQLHRLMVFVNGFIFSDKFRYEILFWTVNSASQVAIVGNLGYRFHEAFNLFGGVSANAGSRSMTGSWPYFFGTDRQLADDYFRPGFTGGIWANGRLFDMLAYKVMIGNNLSQIYINAQQLTRDFAESASIWLMPTTGEFGPRGGFGDYEMHERVATRFGTSFTHSREDRYSQVNNPTPENVQIRISDSLLLFQTGALAPEVTIQRADYNMLAFDAGVKFRGLHIQTEYYLRWLSNFQATGPVPLSKMFDTGFYLQAGYQVWPKRLEVYGVTSQIFGEFNDSYEAGGGLNTWPFSTRNFRINAMATYVHRAPASSLFGYYIGGQTGPTVSVATDLFF